MLQQPLLTVIMPAYNAEKYLDRALTALTKQNNKNFKLIVVNDGSKDKTLEIARSYQDRFPYYQVINKKNSGPSDSRNLGLAEVTTPYVTFHDADDWTDPQYTDFCIKAFANYPVDLVCSGFWLEPKRRVAGKPGKGYLTKTQALLKIKNSHSSFKGYTWNKVYKMRIINKYHLRFVSDLALMEDEVFNVRYISLSHGVYYTSTPYYHYFQHADSIVHNMNPKKVPDNFRANYIVWKRIAKTIVAENAKKKAQQAVSKKKKDKDQSESLI